MNQSTPIPKFTMREETDPVEIAKARASFEKFNRNFDWLEAHATEVYSHRGKYICIAGQELFVGDDVLEVVARARAAHPDDNGFLTQYVQIERAARVFSRTLGRTISVGPPVPNCRIVEE
jgi:hypothetical protein